MSLGQQELKDIIEKHRKWLKDGDGGERANLSYANLSYANLNGANLSYADLNGANLSYADLNGANLNGANLSYANLIYANLSYADLSSANLRYADLSSADLRYADLSSANLSSADLSSADLSSANLSSANLSSANLRYADLSSANLSSIKEDFFKRLLMAKNEVSGLYDYLMRGKIDGSSYEGECACFVGTIANITKQPYQELSSGLKPDAASPTEKWFLAIREGDVPQSNVVSKITQEWIEEFCKEHSIILPSYKLISNLEFPEVFK